MLEHFFLWNEKLCLVMKFGHEKAHKRLLIFFCSDKNRILLVLHLEIFEVIFQTSSL